MKNDIRKQLGLVDSRSDRAILSRGKNIYNGTSNSPNPKGNNNSSAIKLKNERKRALLKPAKDPIAMPRRIPKPKFEGNLKPQPQPMKKLNSSEFLVKLDKSGAKKLLASRKMGKS